MKGKRVARAKITLFARRVEENRRLSSRGGSRKEEAGVRRIKAILQ